MEHWQALVYKIIVFIKYARVQPFLHAYEAELNFYVWCPRK